MLALAVVAAQPVAPSAAPQAADRKVAAGLQAIAAASNQFAISAYYRLQPTAGSFAFSPYSLSAVFAMAYEGARKETAEDIKRVFLFPRDHGSRRSSYAALQKSLGLANGVWTQQ